MPNLEKIYVKQEIEDEHNNSVTQAETSNLEIKCELLKKENSLSYDSDSSDYNDQSDASEDAPEYFGLKNPVKEEANCFCFNQPWPSTNIDQPGPSTSSFANVSGIGDDTPSNDIFIQDGAWIDGTFKCGSCNFSTEKEIVLEAHMRDCLLEARYSSMLASILAGIKQRCYFCPFESDSLDALKEHHHVHTSKGQTANYECEKCGFSTEKRFQLVTHILTHNKFKCTQCPYFHTYERSVKMHNKNHGVSVKLIAACKSCSFEAVDRGAWEGHLTAHKLSGQAIAITCAMCTFRGDTHYNQRSVEVHHKQLNHRGFLAEISLFRCVDTSCSFTNYFRWDFVKHVKSNHPDASPGPASLNGQSCSKCSFVATSVSKLSEHFQNIHARTLYKCDGCQFETKRKERYDLHMIDVKLTQRHEKRHHSINDLKLYSKCDLDTFTNPNELDTNESQVSPNLRDTVKVVSLDNNKDLAHSNELPNKQNIDCLNTNAKVSVLNYDNSENQNLCINAASVVHLNTYTVENEEIKNEVTNDISVITDISKNQNLNINPALEFPLNVFDSDVSLKPDTFENPNVTINAASVVGQLNAYTEKNKEIKNEIFDGDIIEANSVAADLNLKLKGKEISVLKSGKVKTSPYKCFYCEFAADKKIDVDRHEKTAHRTFDGLYTCPYCSYETTKRCDVRRHYTRKHKDSLKCNDCPFETASKSEFIQHTASHKRTGLKLHYCSVCEYSSNRKSMVGRHELTHRETGLFCDQCDYKCRRKDDLARHKSKKHSSQPGFFFKR